MKLLETLIASAAVLTINVANATVIDFEDLSGQGALPSNYAGLTWGTGWWFYDWAQAPFTPSSGIVRVYNESNPTGDWFKFSSDVVFDGAYFSGFDFAQFELFNDGVLVNTSASVPLSNWLGIPVFLSSGYSGLIDEVRINASNGWFAMDDVTFNNVPEPAALALMGVGLAGLGFSRRRKAVRSR